MNFGEGLFVGRPVATKEVLELIGTKGVEHIDQRLKELLKYRMELFGSGHSKFKRYGFEPLQKFFDTRERVVLAVEDIISSSKLEERKKGIYTISTTDQDHAFTKADYPTEKEVSDWIKKGFYNGSDLRTRIPECPPSLLRKN